MVKTTVYMSEQDKAMLEKLPDIMPARSMADALRKMIRKEFDAKAKKGKAKR